MRRTNVAAAAVALSLLAIDVPRALAAEPADHPEIGRYERSSVLHQERRTFDAYSLGLGPVRDGKVSDVKKAEGKVLLTTYRAPDASSLEIFRTYRSLLESKGFEILFACEKGECGEKFLGRFYDLAPFANDYGWNNSAPITQGNTDFSYVLVARAVAGPRTSYVSLIVSQGWWAYPVYKLDVLEVLDRKGTISSEGSARNTAGDAPSPAPAPALAPAAAAPAAPAAVRRGTGYGLQIYSDSVLGLALRTSRLEVGVVAQAVLHDGFVAAGKPDDIAFFGSYVGYLFQLPDLGSTLGVGFEMRRGQVLKGKTVYRQLFDAGPRLSLDYPLGDHFLISGVLHPFWAELRETSVVYSYGGTYRLPYAAIAIGYFF
jgi:hypothetical protein